MYAQVHLTQLPSDIYLFILNIFIIIFLKINAIEDIKRKTESILIMVLHIVKSE